MRAFQTLVKLYRGEISPHDQKSHSTVEMKKYLGECDRIEKILKANLSEEDFQLFKEYNEYSDVITDLSMEDKFYEGFKLCANLIAEVQ